MYFQNFPVIYYDFVINGEPVLKAVTDITVNMRIYKDILSNIALYDKYDIVDGDTPDIIATKVYGNPLYHWVIMLTNDAYSHTRDFPVSYSVLMSHIDEVYGESKYATHHFEDEHGHWVSSNYPLARAVSNHDYEVSLNEAKRSIKIISPNLLSSIMSQYQDII